MKAWYPWACPVFYYKILLAFLFSTSDQSHQKNSDALGQKRKMKPLLAKRAGNFQGLEINFGKLELVYFMMHPDLEGFGYYEAPWTMNPWGSLPPALSWWPCQWLLYSFVFCVPLLSRASLQAGKRLLKMLKNSVSSKASIDSSLTINQLDEIADLIDKISPW